MRINDSSNIIRFCSQTVRLSQTKPVEQPVLEQPNKEQRYIHTQGGKRRNTQDVFEYVKGSAK